jgi:glycosyltransferase involved in cell wall biosynthesis
VSPSDSPLFSVVLPTRNRPELLEEAIASVLAQGRPDWELVVVDDGSVPSAVVPADARVRLIRCEGSPGAARARNVGVAEARGRLVVFLDDDDLFTRDRLDLAAQGLERAPLAICWSRFLDRASGSNVTLEGDVRDVILDSLTPSLGATAIRRDRFVCFDERWQMLEDVDWWLRIVQSNRVTTVPTIGYLVRRRAGPDQERLRRRAEENRTFLEERADYFRRHPRAAAFRLRRTGLLLLASGDARRARSAFVDSLRARWSWATLWHVVRSGLFGAGRRAGRLSAEPR